MATLLPPLVAADMAAASPGDITTVAGNGTGGSGGDGGPAPLAGLGRPWGVAMGPSGMFISQNAANLLRKVDGSGTISRVAGGGTVPLGDGGSATGATLRTPTGVVEDSAGNLFVADSANHRVRRVDHATGVITTVAGTGTAGFSGDGGQATAAQVNNPQHLAVDTAGNLFVADGGNRRVRRIDAGTGVITTYAGTGASGSSGDGGSATAATVTPRGLAADPAGHLYVSDGPRVRKVDATSGFITTVVGTGTAGFSGEGGPATAAQIGSARGLATDAAANLFIADSSEHRIRKVDSSGIITTVAGAGDEGASGDGGLATEARLATPLAVTVDAAGNVFLTEVSPQRVRRVDATTGIISTFAGSGSTDGYLGDDLPATQARFGNTGPLLGQVFWASGDLFVADASSDRIRRVGTDGFITTVVGGGVGDGHNATTAAVLVGPRGVATDAAGNPFVADCGSRKVRAVDLSTGIISAVAGGGAPADHLGDGGPATGAVLFCPSGLHRVTSGPSAGTFYIADAGAHRVRKVDPAGVITTVAGDGSAGYGGDGGPATAAKLNTPSGVAVDGAGNVLIADTENQRIRKVDPAGKITTVAGDGAFAIGSDGVAATAGSLGLPTAVAVEPSGAIVIAESGFHRLRRVSPTGIITTMAGNGIPAFAGDGGPANAAMLNTPTDVARDAAGALLVTDRSNHRIRRIEAGTPPPPPTTGCGMVITKNTTLKADLGPCPGDGIVVGADRITLNLNGFSVYGTDATGNAAGIRLYARKGVTIKGGGTTTRRGTVRGFDAGVLLVGGSGHTIQDLVVRDNIGPGIDDAILGDGIAVIYSADNRILSSVVSNNGIYDGIGILGIGAHRNLVQDTVVEKTNSQSSGGPTGIGIAATPFFSEDLPRRHSLIGNRFLSNKVRDNDNSGISNISNLDGVIRANVVERNGFAQGASPRNGIGVQNLTRAQPETKVLVQGNTVVGNGGDGLNITSNENRVIGNEVHGNLGSGILVRASSRFGKGNEIRDNNAADNTPQGYNRGDLVDTNFSFDDEGYQVFDCDQNVWFGNIWGSGRYWPDPDLFSPEELDEEGMRIPEACTAVGGHDAGGGTSAPAAASASVPPAQSPTAEAEGGEEPATTSNGHGHSRRRPPIHSG